MQTRSPIVWSVPAPEAAGTAPVATEGPAGTEPAAIPATEADTPAEESESEKPKARTVNFGLNTDTVDTTAKASVVQRGYLVHCYTSNYKLHHLWVV